MSRFNLLYEPWISVITDNKGTSKEVGLIDLFQHAHEYKDLAGDTKTQDFAVFRVLLAVIFTVYSRFDAEGAVHEQLEVDERFKQVDDIYEDDIDDYEEALLDTWQSLYRNGRFSDIVMEYLKRWEDRFYLYDDQYPFFQVTRESILEIVKDKKNMDKEKTLGVKDVDDFSIVSGKSIDRLISESENKKALFSYKDESHKSILTDSEIARWLITYQAYSEKAYKWKAIYKKGDFKESDGWLHNLGGIFLKKENLFETLLFNWSVIYDGNNLNHMQQPCWESSSYDMLKKHDQGNYYENNISELYTTWSKAIYIDENQVYELIDFTFGIAKLPELDKGNHFIEPMTLWNKKEDVYLPCKHSFEKSIWRSFGLISPTKEELRKPGIIDWLTFIKGKLEFSEEEITIFAISMENDGKGASVPTNEITDSLNINNLVLLDYDWTVRINEMVDLTKQIIETVYKFFIDDVKKIRNIGTKDYTSIKMEEAYYKIDQSFREWLRHIQVADSKEEKIGEWKKTLKKMMMDMVEDMVVHSGNRDFIGIVENENNLNIAVAYNKFLFKLGKQLM